MQNNAAQAAPKRYETYTETSQRLRVSRRTAENLVNRKIIPVIKLGRRCLFDPIAVDAALAKRTLNRSAAE